MKKIILFTALFAFSTLAFAGDPTPKVLEAFQKCFHQVPDVHWYNKDNVYVAYFRKDDIAYNIAYDDKGHTLHTVRYYGQANYLPFDIRSAVTARFGGFAIYAVAELSMNGETVYEIYLQNAKTLLTAQASDYGDIVEVARYKRTNAAGQVSQN